MMRHSYPQALLLQSPNEAHLTRTYTHTLKHDGDVEGPWGTFSVLMSRSRYA